MPTQFTLTLTREQVNYLSALLYRDLMPAPGCGGVAYNPVWVEAIPKPIVAQLQDHIPIWEAKELMAQLNKVK
jgi:hypothetical protein